MPFNFRIYILSLPKESFVPALKDSSLSLASKTSLNPVILEGLRVFFAIRRLYGSTSYDILSVSPCLS